MKSLMKIKSTVRSVITTIAKENIEEQCIVLAI